MFARIRSFIRAFFTYVLEGTDVELDEYIRRLGVCERCEHCNRKLQTCKRCGCVLKLKATIKEQHCDKW